MKLAFAETLKDAFVAEDPVNHFYVWGGDGNWYLNVQHLFRDGVRANIVTQPVIAYGKCASQEQAMWTASEFSALGEDYTPAAHGGRKRIEEAQRRVRAGEHLLRFRKVEAGEYKARSPHADYSVWRGFKTWHVNIRALAVTSGVTHSVGTRVLGSGLHPTKALCVSIAEHFHWLGEGYQPHHFGHRERFTEAVTRAYAAERARREAERAADGEARP